MGRDEVMSDEKHTPGPWSYGKEGIEWLRNVTHYVRCPGGHALAECHFVECDNEANARRIVACVNACAGVSNSALRPGVVLEMADRLAGNALSRVVLIDAAREAIRLCREMRSATAEEVLAKALSACEPQ
jgi:hypothetical protein